MEYHEVLIIREILGFYISHIFHDFFFFCGFEMLHLIWIFRLAMNDIVIFVPFLVSFDKIYFLLGKELVGMAILHPFVFL